MNQKTMTLILSLMLFNMLNAPAFAAEESETYVTRDSYYSIDIKEVSNHLFSIVSSINSFVTSKKDQVHSLLDFEFKQEPSQKVEPYQRKHHFGGWAKNRKLGDCYNTRAKVLIRDSLKPVIFKKENPCSVIAGSWVDPYAGAEFTDAQDIQIDHMVPLKEAYIAGAYKWTFKERCLYGNYLGYKRHLIAVDGEENNQKSDQTPIDYIPPKKDYLCTYAKDWLTVKALWGLTFTKEEKDYLNQIVKENNCDTSQFAITEKELQMQYDFFENNLKLCDGLAKLNKNKSKDEPDKEP